MSWTDRYLGSSAAEPTPGWQSRYGVSAASDEEARFRAWYAERAKRLNLDPNPDDPRHHYDYRAAFRAGAEPDPATGHWPSTFKADDHPNRYVGILDTKTGQPKPIPGAEPGLGAEPEEGPLDRAAALGNRFVTGAADWIVSIPEVGAKAYNAWQDLINPGLGPGGESPSRVPTEYPTIGKPGGFFDLKAGREDIRRQADAATERLRASRGAPETVAAADTIALGLGAFLPLGEGAAAAHRVGAKLADAVVEPLAAPAVKVAERRANPEMRASVDAALARLHEAKPSPAELADIQAQAVEAGDRATEVATERYAHDLGSGHFAPPAGRPSLDEILGEGGGQPEGPALPRQAAPARASEPAPPPPPPAEIGAPGGAQRDFPPVPRRAVTERGTAIDFDYEVRDASDLVTSHDVAMRPRPDYPAELQPRDRSRVASEAQVDRIERQLNPELLGKSPHASTGAPIVGPDGIVESGNARSIALQRAYRRGGESADRYRGWLEANAPRFGVDPVEVAARREPVLVRVRRTPVDRAAFAAEANEAPLARMSATEQAAADAQRITPAMLDSLRIPESGEVNFQANRDFVRAFTQQVPTTEVGAMYDARGLLSAEGHRRLQNAVLARAYGDADAVAQLVEHADSNVRGVGNALFREAPRFARLREDVAAGRLHPLDISDDIGAALRKLSALRQEGTKVPDYLAQGGLFGSELTPESRALLAIFDANGRSSARVAGILDRYASLAEGVGHPEQAGLFGGRAAPSKLDLLREALAEDPGQASLFALAEPPPASSAVEAELGQAPSPAPRPIVREGLFLGQEEPLAPTIQRPEPALGPRRLPEPPTESEPLPGMEPPPPGLTTGTKHAVTRAERLAEGLPEIENLAKKDSATWAEAKTIFEQDPEAPRTLAQHLTAKPRPISDVENDLLLHDRMQMTLDHKGALAAEEAALQSGDQEALALARIRRQSIEQAKDLNDRALDLGGSESGRALRARQKLIAEDYSPLHLTQRYRVANEGVEAPEPIRQKLTEISAQLELAQARATAAEERAQELEALRVIRSEQGAAAKAGRSGKRAASRQDLDAEYSTLSQAFAKRAATPRAGLDPELAGLIAKMAKNRVQAGTTSVADLVDGIYQETKPYLADLEPRDIRDVIAGAGPKAQKAAQSEAVKEYARLRSQAKLLNKLDDIYAGEGLSAAAPHAAPSPEVAALRTKLQQVTEDLRLKPAATDQQRLARVKAALETRLQRAERGVLPSRRPRVTSPETEALRAKLEKTLEEQGVLVSRESRVRAALANAKERLQAPNLDPDTRKLLEGEVARWEVDLVNPGSGRGPMLEPERLGGAKKRVATRIAELQQQIATGEFIPKGRAPVAADAELLAARGQVRGLQRQADTIIRRREMANRGALEKGMDWTAGWGRFLKLTGTATLQKIAAAASERALVFKPIEEFIGAGLSKLPGVSKVAAKAPIEGGGSMSAIAKSYGAFFGEQARAEMKAGLAGRETPMELAFKSHAGYGERVPSWMEYPGRVHTALKGPARVAGYQYAMEKQAQWYLGRGEADMLLNPVAQEEMKARAWEYATRDIFMGDNAAVRAFNKALASEPGESLVAKGGKTAGRVLMPIVKVPTNYALEVTDYALGLPKGMARLGAAVRDGLDKLPAAEAEQIMRQLKKGSLGAGLIALGATGVVEAGGYYEPGKHRRESELPPGEVRIAGVTVPHMLLHHPAVEALQIGASLFRATTLAAGLGNAAWGVAEQVPFFEEPLTAARTLREDPSQFFGSIERGMTIPPDVQRAARILDQKKPRTTAEMLEQQAGWGGLGVDGVFKVPEIETRKRKARGGFLEQLGEEEMLGIPGAREHVR